MGYQWLLSRRNVYEAGGHLVHGTSVAKQKVTRCWSTRMIRRLFLLVLAVAVAATAQDSPAFRRVKHLRHGINVSEWFAQTGDYSPQRLRNYTKLEDID